MASPPDQLIEICDVHDCIHALDVMMEALQPQQSDTLVFLGDLIDQGNSHRRKSCRIFPVEP